MSAPMPRLDWVYRALAVRVIDGDSLVMVIDAGFGLHVHGNGNEGAHIRLLGVDTPERNEPGWAEAKAFTAAWLAEADDQPWPLLIATMKADNFGRYLGWLWRRKDGASLNDDLIEANHAVMRLAY